MGEKRYIFCGSRGWTDPAPIRARLKDLPEDAVVVAGGARGADKIAEQEARKLGFEPEVYPAEWRPQGPDGPTDYSAGYRRNELMANLPDVAGVFAFRMPGKSNGTDHMIGLCKERAIPGRLITPKRAKEGP